MGCDIHLIIERKIILDNKTESRIENFKNKLKEIFISKSSKNNWLGLYATGAVRHNKLLGEDRNYYFFNKLAGVRAWKGEELNSPKGIPSDISDLARYSIDFYGEDGHSHSYMSVREFCKIFNEARDNEHWSDKNKNLDPYYILGIDRLTDEEYDDDLYLDKYRVVFFFDC